MGILVAIGLSVAVIGPAAFFIVRPLRKYWELHFIFNKQFRLYGFLVEILFPVGLTAVFLYPLAEVSASSLLLLALPGILAGAAYAFIRPWAPNPRNSGVRYDEHFDMADMHYELAQTRGLRQP